LLVGRSGFIKTTLFRAASMACDRFLCRALFVWIHRKAISLGRGGGAGVHVIPRTDAD
jgi:hypothetical protein